jgi:pyruvate formate lyase activating enzyme
MKGLIFDIKRYSIHDGPGIRVTFFMKGCPLSCLWCHNPEGISQLPAIAEKIEKVGAKEFRKDEAVGKYFTPAEVLAILSKERVFFGESGGGVTFSGGEPMMQFDFLLDVLMLCKRNGFHTVVDTSGFSTPDRFRSILLYTDLFLFDIKHLDDEKHKVFTGVSNREILQNYRLISDSDTDFVVRIPVIPGFNDDNEDLAAVKMFIQNSRRENLKMISLLPYHKTGSSKYRKFNIINKMEKTEPPSPERMNELKDFFSDLGVRVKIGG